MKKLFCILLSVLCVSVAKAQTDGYAFLSDSNGVALPGFYLNASNLLGTIPNAALPTNYVPSTTFALSTNYLATNGLAQLLNASNVLAASVSAGTNFGFTNTTAQLNLSSNFLATNFLAMLNTSSNFLATNFTAQLNTTSNALLLLDQTNISTASNSLAISIASLTFNTSAMTNALGSNITAVATALTATSNYLNDASNTLTANLSTAATGNTNYSLTVSNNLKIYIAGVSNLISQGKAFSATVPATYSSIGIGFSTPLMPDGNYSVQLTPQNQTTAEAPSAGLFWWVGSKNNSGFTIYTSFATNGYDLNFECTINRNTQ